MHQSVAQLPSPDFLSHAFGVDAQGLAVGDDDILHVREIWRFGRR